MSSFSLQGLESSYIDNDKDILNRMATIHKSSNYDTQNLWLQQSIDERFHAGDQSLWGEIYSALPLAKRKQFNFNKIRRIVNMISGYQRRNRKSLNIIPVENSDQETSDQFSKVIMWLNQRANAMNTISDAFMGSLITGMNLLFCWVDRREDPYSGDIKINNLGYNGYIIDPYFQKIDLSDCNYIWTCNYRSKRQIISLMPDRRKEIEDMAPTFNRNEYFNFLPQNYNNTNTDLLPYSEFWYLDYRDATILVDVENEDVMEWTGPEENLRLFLMMNPRVKTKKIQKQTCKLAIVVNNQVMYHGKNPFKIDRYPFVPMMGYYQPTLPLYENRIQGVVRGLRDSQFILNRRQQILLDVLESQINSGLKVMEDSLIDDRDAFKAGQGQALFIKKDAPLGMESVQKIPPADVSPAFIQVIDQMNANMMDIAGVNEELLGSADDDKAGILSMLRQGAGLTTLQVLFDHCDEAVHNLGRIELDLIQANFTPSKISRIIEGEPSQQFYNKTFQKFDCEVVEGSDTPTQRMLGFKQALHLKEIGIPITSRYLLEISTLQNKTELMEEVAQQEQQQQQMQEQQMKLQMMELEARANLANARAAADYGLEKERATRSISNLSLSEERRMEAIKDLNQSELDKIKAIKELQGMDLSHIQQSIEIMQAMKAQEAAQVEQASPAREAMNAMTQKIGQ